MGYKIIEILVKDDVNEAIDKILAKKEIITYWKIANCDNRMKCSMIVEEKNVEILIDSIAKALHLNDEIDNYSDVVDVMILSPVEGFLPKIKDNEDKKKKNKKVINRISTEEMYDNIVDDTKISQNFILNIILSSIVCSVGIIKEDISILIAASAIAPFLGSILGYSFGISIGDKDVIKNSVRTLFTGVLISLLIGTIIGFLWNRLPNTYAIEIGKNLFKEVEFTHYTFVLALASGISASLAITSGLSTLMASFMVAVSILPNITISGIILGNGLYKIFVSSFMLLSINLICIIFSSQITFEFKKLKPKTKEAMENSKSSNILNIIYCVLILIILVSLRTFISRS